MCKSGLLLGDPDGKLALHFDNFDVSFWTDKPVRDYSREANDDGTKQSRPEAVNDEAGNQHGS
jgi:hypothetical protein